MLWLASALAHPLGGVMPSHDLRLELQADRIEALYGARLPTHDVLKAIGEQADFSPEDATAYNTARLRELRENLTLTVDGSRVPWEEATPTPESGTGNSRFVLFEQTLRAPFAGGELLVVNSNDPDALSYFRVDVVLGPMWVAEQCSLWERVEATVEKSRNGTWRLEEESRELTLLVRPTGWWEAPRVEGARGVDQALGPGLPWTWAVGAGATLLAAGLALLRAARRRPASPPA